MRTPAGKECKYFYGDYYRGKNAEECRLIGHQPPPNHWTADLCKACPVPGILQANSCPNMTLSASIKRKLPGLKRKVIITAYCSRSQGIVKDPHVGCGLCHDLPDAFIEEQ